MKRVKERDGADEERARWRIGSQMSNGEAIDHAHIVFCTMWEYEYTQQQVRRKGGYEAERERGGKEERRGYEAEREREREVWIILSLLL